MGRPKKERTVETWECPKCKRFQHVLMPAISVSHGCPEDFGKGVAFKKIKEHK